MKAKILGLLAVVLMAAPFTTGATTLNPGLQLFNFDLRSDLPAPPYQAIQFFLQFAASDPVIGSDLLQVTFYGDQNGGGFITLTTFPASIFQNGGTSFAFSTANPIYDPLLDGVFSMGLSMPSGTAELTSFRACGLIAGQRCSAPAPRVPEPGTLALLGLGLAGLGVSRRRKAN